MCVHVCALSSSQCQAEGINSKGSAVMGFNFSTLLACQWIECAQGNGGAVTVSTGKRELQNYSVAHLI